MRFHLKKISKNEEELVIKSDLTNLPQVEKLSQHITDKMGFNEEQAVNLAIALTELVNNAIVHGNKNDPSKKVVVHVVYTADHVQITVADEGEGFEVSEVPNPLNAQNLWKEHGRGIFLVRNLIDSVEFVPTEKGTKVVLKEYVSHKN